MSANNPIFGFQQSFYTDLPECYVAADAAHFSSPELVYFNTHFASSITANFPSNEQALAELFSGQALPDDAKPIAQAYAGHQFGHFNPQLGDGRAMILGELTCHNGNVIELDLKGSGPTNFSRQGDGKAAIGPMLREVLISEAMHALGIATTRSLAVVSTGDRVHRDPPQVGAVLARTASSHIRIGTFQYFAARDQHDVLEKLVQYCIGRHYPALKHSTHPALDLLQATVNAQARLVAQWMGIGFIHGVMNTDNVLIGAETIDFGPCAFMDVFDPTTVFSSIDQNSRYAYMNQPPVTQWNLARFAETLIPLLHNDKDEAIALATKAVKSFSEAYDVQYRLIMCHKLGLQSDADPSTLDSIIEQWTKLLYEHKLDWTNAHIALSEYVANPQESSSLIAMCQTDNLTSEGLTAWLVKRNAVASNNYEVMKQANPMVIPRNHLVEEALNAAISKHDFEPFETLLEVLENPFSKPANNKYMQAGTAAFAEDFVTFCGT